MNKFVTIITVLAVLSAGLFACSTSINMGKEDKAAMAVEPQAVLKNYHHSLSEMLPVKL